MDALTRLDRTEGRAWGGFLRAHARITQQLDAELREAHDLPLTWYDALWQLYVSPAERLRMSDLAERVLLTQSGLSRLVGRLEEEGLVRREPDPDDGRATLALLTPVGRARLAEAHPTHLAGIRRHFLDHLCEEEQVMLAELWQRLASATPDRPTSRHRPD